MQGQRRFRNKFGKLLLAEGEFGQDNRSNWWVRPPGGDAVRIDTCDVKELSGERITVGSLIRSKTFTGYLDRGKWRQQNGPDSK